MKSVLISIQPKWCDLIAIGQKTIEVRKNKPKLATPFKVYIYETNWKNNTYWANKHKGKMGKVIGEFVCDRIDYVRNYGDMVDSYDCVASCLSANEIIEYAKDKNGNFVYTYGWHISDLKIYDEPKALSRFLPCKYPWDCGACSYYDREQFTCEKPIRPPQSWCYVEEEEQ
jgi:predicted transcriptional regulator